MSRTLLAAAVLVAIAAGICLASPGMYGAVRDTLTGPHPGAGAGIQLSGMHEEGNGMVGRFVEFMEHSVMHPMHLAAGTILLMIVLGGMALYWRSVRD